MTDILDSAMGDAPFNELSRALRWWASLTKDVNVREEEIRIKEREALLRADECQSVTGCSWYKCVRYEDRDRYPLMCRCSTCQRQVYCGVLCQTR